MNRRTFGQAAIGALLAPTAQAAKARAEILLPVPLHGPLPAFQNGVLSVLDAALTTVSLIDRSGNVLGAFSPRIPGAAVERILHVSVSPERNVALAVSAKEASGRHSVFLVFADCAGRISTAVPVHPFAPRRLLFLPGGRLLCLGREYTEQWDDVPGYNVLRFYSAEGRFQKSALPVTAVRSGTASHPADWSLVAGADRIGMIDAENRRYCEIDLEGQLIRPAEDAGVAAPDQITGIALLPNGDRLVTLDRPKSEGDRLRYGHHCAAVQISGPAGAPLSVVSRPDLVPAGGGKDFVIALGCSEGQMVLLARPPDRLLIFEV